MNAIVSNTRRLAIPLLVLVGALALVVGTFSTTAEAGKPGGSSCVGVSPRDPDGCDSPAGSGGKGCEHGKGLNKKQNGADCGGSGNDAPPIVSGDDGTSGDGSSGSDDGSTGSDGGSRPGSNDGSDSDSDSGSDSGSDGDADDSDGASVLGKQVTRDDGVAGERARSADPEALAFTGPTGSSLLMLAGGLMTIAGTVLHLAGRGSRRQQA